MPETPEEFVARALSAQGTGRLPMPPVADWETFPFDGDIRVREFNAAVPPEKPRFGETEDECWRCQKGDEDAVWSDDHWVIGSLDKPSGLPVVVLLMPRVHCDIDDMPSHVASGLGPMMMRVEVAIQKLGHIGRVHIGRWGDGSAHLHWWFMARPARVPQLKGSFAAIWDDIVPPLPESIWRENLAIVANAMAAGGGTALI